MQIGCVRETASGEPRVALSPETASKLVKLGAEVVIESELGSGLHWTDEHYVRAGARIGRQAVAVSPRVTSCCVSANRN